MTETWERPPSPMRALNGRHIVVRPDDLPERPALFWDRLGAFEQRARAEGYDVHMGAQIGTVMPKYSFVPPTEQGTDRHD
jgi:hypothetical protein